MNLMEVDEHPKLFVSYSWTSPEHIAWVMSLANDLVQDGVDVIIDKWHLTHGQDSDAFMERMVTDPDIKKVILVCDKAYAEKANARKGGVGTEALIISGEIYSKADQTKFVAVVAEKDSEGKPYVPAYYGRRIYIDLSEETKYVGEYERLLRWIYGKAEDIKPELGKKPAFLSEPPELSLGTSTKWKRALDAIRNNKTHADGALQEYFETLATGLEKFRITDKDGHFDDKVIESIERFIPYRNEAIEIFLALALYRDTEESYRRVHRFFEKLVPYLYAPQSMTHYTDRDFDNFKFIVHELFLYEIASLLKYERFRTVAFLVGQPYYAAFLSLYGRDPMQSYSVFRKHAPSFDERNQRLQLGRVSVHSDLLIERTHETGFNRDELMQADFVLFLRDALDALRSGGYLRWFPYSLLYKDEWGTTFEIFVRSESAIYFDKVKVMFDINDKADLAALLTAFRDRRIDLPSWQTKSVAPGEWMNFKRLVTRP